LGRRTENGKIRIVAGKNRDALSGGPVQPLRKRRSAGRNPAIEVAPGKALAGCKIDACERVGPRLRVKRDAIGGRRRRGHARGSDSGSPRGDPYSYVTYISTGKR